MLTDLCARLALHAVLVTYHAPVGSDTFLLAHGRATRQQEYPKQKGQQSEIGQLWDLSLNHGVIPRLMVPEWSLPVPRSLSDLG